MPEAASADRYRRQATPMERLFTRSPFSVVSVVARIRGDVNGTALTAAVEKAQQRHRNLRVVLVDDTDHSPWFTTEGESAITIEVVSRAADTDWVGIVQQASRIPFEFQQRPAVRVILVRSPEISEMIVVCHHILCDGLSLAYLVRDILEYLGDESREVAVLPDPVPITPEMMPPEVSLNPVVRLLMGRINRKWRKDPVFFDQQDYELLAAAYWDRYEHQLLPIELSDAETTELVERCRREGVTVNTALVAAFTGAQSLILGDSHQADVAVAANLRQRLQPAVGEVMGFYAGAVTLSYEYDPDSGFWENARRLHPELRAEITDKALFQEPLLWSNLDPTILEAINFKKIGGLVAADTGGSQKLRDFSQRNDVVHGILKRDGLESLDRVFLGTAVTNLTRLDIPSTYGPLTLDRLFMKPGGAFPLANVNLVVGAVTAARRLSLALEYVEDNVTSTVAKAIEAQALSFLQHA